jgi:hypothetical protein
MQLPSDRAKSDSAEISAVDDAALGNISSQYTAFVNGSNALVKSFHGEMGKHGSILNIPFDILQKYSIPFRSILDLSKNLRRDIENQIGIITEELDRIKTLNGVSSSLFDEVRSKREKLFSKLEYFDGVEILFIAIEFRIERKKLAS